MIGDALLQTWVAQVLTDSSLALHGPHSYSQPLTAIRSAHQAVLRDVGLKSLQDASDGSLSLQGVKTSALASVKKWQEACSSVLNMRRSLTGDTLLPIHQFDALVGSWRDLAVRKLAHPTTTGQRLIVLDTNALMLAPDLLTTMRRNDIPVVARRVLEELDGIKDSPKRKEPRRRGLQFVLWSVPGKPSATSLRCWIFTARLGANIRQSNLVGGALSPAE